MELALNEVTIVFADGETTFVVGRSGSGKSTLGHLLVKSYQPNTGLIAIDNTSPEDTDAC